MDDDGYDNNQLHEIGHKTCTAGWFFSEGEAALLAHDDGSCTFYDVPNSEDKFVYKAPTEAPLRDCWIERAPGMDGCAGMYVVAASAAGFCAWDLFTKEITSFHTETEEDGDISTTTASNRQWWYKPCGPLIISTASNQKAVRIYDIRDGEHIMKWDLQNCVSTMENSSPLQWRNGEKVVVVEAEEIVSLWDVGFLTPKPLLSVSSSGKKITALHINNTAAARGGGVRESVSRSEVEGNDGVFCTSDSINVLDFRHPSGIGIKIPKRSSSTVHSVFPRGDSIYLGCSSGSSNPTSSSEIQQFSVREQKLFSTYSLPPDSNGHPSHDKAITQVWGNSNLTMGVCSLGLYVFDAGDQKVIREIIGPDNLHCPSFDYTESKALLISRNRPAVWKYLS